VSAAEVIPIRPGADSDERPIVKVGTDLKDAVDRVSLALAADPDLYQREGALVRVTRDPASGVPTIRPHTLATLRVRIAEFTRMQRWEAAKKDPNGGDWVDCLPPDTVTKAVLEQSEWTGPRMLRGILEAPALRPDGTVLDAPGYDPATGYLLLPTTKFPAVPSAPSQARAAEALRYMWTELCFDFPFRGMGYPDPAATAADREGVFRYLAAKECPDAWGVVAAILTLLARPAITGSIPAFLFDASGPGAGKGMSADIASIVATGRVPAKLTWPNRGAETDDHVEKMLGGEALGGATITMFDEINGDFGGPAINKVLTGNGWTKMRILGASSTPVLPWLSVMLGAGCNITFCDNTHRRILVPRIESTDENPEDHTGFRHDELLEWTTANRGVLVCAALTVLRGYVLAGCPEVGVPLWRSFEPWTRLVARAIVWAGGGNVLGCRPTVDPEARNEEREAMSAIVLAVEKLAPTDGSGITAGRLLDALYSPERLRGEDKFADGWDDTREAIEALTRTPSGKRPSSKSLGDHLKKWKTRPIGTRRLAHAAKADRSGVARWVVLT